MKRAESESALETFGTRAHRHTVQVSAAETLNRCGRAQSGSLALQVTASECLECWQRGGRLPPNTLLICYGGADSHPALTRGAVSASDGVSRSPSGRGAGISTNEKVLCQSIDSDFMSPQCELVIFMRDSNSSPQSPWGDEYLKMVSATFTDLFNSECVLSLPWFIHHCPTAPPSVCIFFILHP